MCDTFAYVGEGFVLFAKNSDREVNEPQVLLWQNRKIYKNSEKLKCTYITIPQVKETNAILISKPTWMWGAEMGTNEFGVTIGNEAVFTKKKPLKIGLTGMDLIRLALERTSTAKEACELIIDLMQTYGQGGNCGYKKRTYYHSSFIIVDPLEGYVLETSGKDYAVERIQGFRAISNGLTIEPFASQNSNLVKSYFTRCKIRKEVIDKNASQNPSVPDFIKLLRLHNPDALSPKYNFISGGMDSPCMHAGGLLLNYQTTASWVSLLKTNNEHLHWVTATSAPCTSLFKPVSVDKPLSEKYSSGGELKEQFWWKHELFQREVMKNPELLLPKIIPELRNIENEWLALPPSSEQAFQIHEKTIEKLLKIICNEKIRDSRPFWVRQFWKKQKIQLF